MLKAGKLRIRPCPGRELGLAEGKWNSPEGMIRSAWSYEDEKLVLDFSVPIPALIELPNGESHRVSKGDYHYELLL